jgi:hypothetical protein
MSQGIAKIRYFQKFQEQKIYFSPIISIGVDLGVRAHENQATDTWYVWH